ncbi:MAG: hypothetical protein AMK71_07910, partial [Nitrospira bacterium SG8_35_4]
MDRPLPGFFGTPSVYRDELSKNYTIHNIISDECTQYKQNAVHSHCTRSANSRIMVKLSRFTAVRKKYPEMDQRFTKSVNRQNMKPVSGTKKRKILCHERIRKIAWEIGQQYPAPLTQEYAALSMVHPRRGCVHWHVAERTLSALRKKNDPVLDNSQVVIRIYDVTDLIFDGANAHMFFDLDVRSSKGIYYFDNNRPGRNYIAEAGLRARDGSFHAVARSGTAYFDRDRPSGIFHTGGLFAGGMLKRTFAVESVFDAPVYERMNRELAGIERDEPLSIAIVYAGINSEALKGPLVSLIK